MEYKRIEIGDGIGFSTVIDEKFKTSALTVRLITELSGETASEDSLAMSVLTDTNSKYTTIAAMSEALTELYGSGISSFISKRGDLMISGISASWLASRYAIYGEDIQGSMLEIFSDCLFRPNVVNGEFESEVFAIAKQELLDRIDAELNSKRDYAIAKAIETAFKGEPAANRCYGTRRTAEAVTSKGAYEAYKRILSTARVEITFVSAEDDPSVEAMMRKGFAEIDRHPADISYMRLSPLKSEPASVSKEFDVNQCKMVMVFKTDCTDVFALRMFSTILGETPVSKLFRNVREKLSLCYYCGCRKLITKGAIIIDSGVERENIEKARTEILAQIADMQKGDFTDEDMENACLAVENSLDQVGDTTASYSSWYFERLCEGKIVTPEEMAADFRSVTKERIIEAAKSLKLDTEYLMLDREVKE